MLMRFLPRWKPARRGPPSALAVLLGDKPAPLGALGPSSPELAAMIDAETDAEVLRQAMRRADHAGDDRWRIATRARLARIAPDPARQADLVQLLCRTRQGTRATAALAALRASALPGDKAAQLNALVAMTCGDYAAAAQAIEAVDVTARHHFENELAMTQLMRGDIDGAWQRARALVRDRPDFGLAAVTAVRAALISEGRAAAREQQADCADAFRLNPDAAAEAEVAILLHLGRQREAAEVVAGALAQYPRAGRLFGQAVGLLFSEVATDRVAAAMETCAGGPERAGDQLLARIIMLSARADFARARATLPALRAHSDWGYHTACVHIACQTDEIDAGVHALYEARAAGVWHGGPEMNAGPFLTMNAPHHPAHADVQRFHEELEPWEHANPGYWTQRLRHHLVLRQDDQARALLARLPAGMRAAHEIVPIGLYLRREELEGPALQAAWSRHLGETAPVAVTAPTAPPEPLAMTWAGTPTDVLLFAVVQNGMEYLPWLIDYYRGLGVDHAFIIDNGSTDGGLEWLRHRAAARGDVSVFAQTGSFRQAAHGVAWTNHLMQRFGVGHWCFHVDMDEAFVFPGMDEDRSLHDLLAYLDATGAETVGAFMLDIYPESLDAPAGADPFSASVMIDRGYTFAPFETPPYRFVLGGLRARMAGQTLLMTKAPLVRMRPDLFFLTNNHFHTAARVADLTGALLHYKFVGDLRRRVDEQVARGEHFMGGRFYKTLQPRLSEVSTLTSDTSVRYSGPAQLLDMGYLGTSRGWREWSENDGKSTKKRTISAQDG